MEIRNECAPCIKNDKTWNSPNPTQNCENISTTIDTVINIPIPDLHIIAPNGNEIYETGNSIEIDWQTGFEFSEIQFVSIYYSQTNKYIRYGW